MFYTHKLKVLIVYPILIFIVSHANSAAQSQSFQQSGLASFYADKFVGRTTANGEKYKHNKLTAAHKTLPFGTQVKVKNLDNGKEVVVRINDRGPFVEGRIIDLSKSAAQKLEFVQKGIVRVEITSVGNNDQSRETYSSLDRPDSREEDITQEYYSLSVNEVKLNGYGIQIGSFTEMVNLVELANKTSKSYKNKTIVQVSVIQGVKYYKLIVGSLSTREKANKLKTKVVKDYPDSFVIKF